MNRQERRNYVKRMNTPYKIEQYSKELDYRVREEYRKIYEEKYQKELEKSISNFIIAVVYTLHFNENAKFDNEKVQDFMGDLLATIELFGNGEYTPEQYTEILKKDGISVVHKKKEEKND